MIDRLWGGQMGHVLQRLGTVIPILALVCSMFIITAGDARAADTFSNNAGITINHYGPASPYPSQIVVSGLVGPITDIDVTLTNVTHTFPADVEARLVSPNGTFVWLLWDNGDGFDVSDATLTLDDEAAGPLPTVLASGSYRPYGPLSALDGSDPNGVWSLVVYDDASADSGHISGWSLHISTNVAGVAQNDSYSVQANSTLTVPSPGLLANDTDPNGDTLEVVGHMQPDNGAVMINPDGSFTYVPNAGFAGADSFSYQATDGEFTTNWATVAITVHGADVALSMGATPNPVRTKTKLTYTTTIHNVGPDVAQNVTVRAELPAQSQFVSATIGQGTCTTPAVKKTGTIVCSLGTVASGVSIDLQYTVTVTAAGGTTLSSSASVTSGTTDPVGANNSVTVTTSVFGRR